jgi:GT2 family glycosyltransferase
MCLFSKSNITVSIIIPTYKDWARLQLCLNALSRQRYPAEYIEIIVVNNDANEDGSQHINLPSNAVLINEATPGSYAARNAALKIAKGEIIAFTDSDCLPSENWVSEAVKVFEENAEAQRVTGPVNIFREINGGWLAWKFESVTAFNQQYNVKSGVSVTANLFIKRHVFSTVGQFNASLFSGGDVEWNKRATLAGVSLLYMPKVLVMHPARLSMHALITKFRRVLGGGFVRAKQEKRLLHYTLRHLVPPVRYAKVLVDDGKPLLDVVLAVLVYWTLKVLMIFEVLRLILGAKPVR